METKILGDTGESIAVKFLQAAGYNIITRNFRYSRNAEIDIIAEIDNILVFVEVKTRYSDKYGTPAEAVTINKQRKIILAATKFLQNNNFFDRTCRFDVIEIYANKNSEWKVNHIQNAFEVN